MYNIITKEDFYWNLAERRPCPLRFDKKLCLPRIDLTSPKWLLGKWLCHFNARSQKVMLTAQQKPIQVGPIALVIATCQTEQIEFVFLRWLVGALNSVLVALLIKAVKANRFSCEPASTWYNIRRICRTVSWLKTRLRFRNYSFCHDTSQTHALVFTERDIRIPPMLSKRQILGTVKGSV